jgi:hypothetical protein
MGHAAIRCRPIFSLAENGGHDARFLQIVAKADRPRRKLRKQKKAQPKLTRVAFRVSRLMEFCTQRELQNQTGHHLWEWPLVVLKELMDNALDACEEAEIAPVISIAVEPGSIVIQDNGGGIKPATIKSILDYTIRVSSREAYVSPTRGAQGNALKTILAMGYVLDRERGGANINNEAVGTTIIETRGTRHHIEFRVDHVNNQPKLSRTTTASPIDVGTKVTVKWPVDCDLLDDRRGCFTELAESYAWFNPHLSLRASWNGEEFINVEPTDTAWAKWGPRNPTSAHWYDEQRLQRYLAAHVASSRPPPRAPPELVSLCVQQRRRVGSPCLVNGMIAVYTVWEASGKQRATRSGILRVRRHEAQDGTPVHDLPPRAALPDRDRVDLQDAYAGDR